jgi:DNA-directed RNA polymerase specialized sigma24 family protein
MTFNYGAERKKFEKNWAETEVIYRKHGMSESAIREMREYDWYLFKAARIEAIHSQDIGFQMDEEDDTDMMESPLLMKFLDQFTSQYDTHGSHSRHWWLEELSDPRFVAALPRLTEDDKELLTLIVVEGYTQEECAVKLHISQRGISYRMQAVFGKFTEK